MSFLQILLMSTAFAQRIELPDCSYKCATENVLDWEILLKRMPDQLCISLYDDRQIIDVFRCVHESCENEVAGWTGKVLPSLKEYCLEQFNGINEDIKPAEDAILEILEGKNLRVTTEIRNNNVTQNSTKKVESSTTEYIEIPEYKSNISTITYTSTKSGAISIVTSVAFLISAAFFTV